MDLETFKDIQAAYAKVQKIADDHEPAQPPEGQTETPFQRFRALGKYVMDRDRYPSRFNDNPGLSQYRVPAFLPGQVTITLVAETHSIYDNRSSIDDLMLVRAEWTAPHVTPPFTQQTANIYEGRELSDFELKVLAEVEESFAEAKPHVSAMQSA